MCTLTYVPFTDGRLCITSNRDEGITRKEATLPQLRPLYDGSHVLMPIDQEAKGTWLATHLQQRRVQVLLNGAFAPHTHTPPYRRSRGLVLLDAFSQPNLLMFQQVYDAARIEPFTLVSIQSDPLTIEEVRWDGNTFHYIEKPVDQPHIWSAAMLYPPVVQQHSEKRFQDLPHFSLDHLLDFHQAEEYTQKMKRDGFEPVEVVQTLSTSQLLLSDHDVHYHYRDHRHAIEVNIQAAWKG